MTRMLYTFNRLGRRLLSLAAAVAVLAAPSAPAATTWYVTPNGSDANAGAESQPFGAVAKGIEFWAGLHARDYKGHITNVSITNCEFADMEGPKVVAIGIIRGLISQVKITGNYAETRKGAGVYVNGGDHRGNPFEWTDPGEIVVTDNEAISYEKSAVMVVNAQKARVRDNKERQGSR